MSRYYDPSIGQFISEDSYRGDGEAFWHLYAYCEGDPVNYTDRTGNISISKEREKAVKNAKKYTKGTNLWKKQYVDFWNKVIDELEGIFPVAMFLLKKSISISGGLTISATCNSSIYYKVIHSFYFNRMLQNKALSYNTKLNSKKYNNFLMTFGVLEPDLALSFHSVTIKNLTVKKLSAINYRYRQYFNSFSGQLYDYYDFDGNDNVANFLTCNLNKYAAADIKNGILKEYPICLNFNIKSYALYY